MFDWALNTTLNSHIYIKSDTCGPKFDFSFNHRILLFILMDYTHVNQYQTKLFETLKNRLKNSFQFKLTT